MNTQIKNVIRHLESQRTAIDTALLALKALEEGRPAGIVIAHRNHDGTRRRGVLTAEGRRRISEAMKARWAAERAHAKRGGGRKAA